MSTLDQRLPARRVAWIAGGAAALVVAGFLLLAWSPWSGKVEDVSGTDREEGRERLSARHSGLLAISSDRQRVLGIMTTEVKAGPVTQVFNAPGQIIPDEAQHAYITPRAPGVVRDVLVQIGQQVEEGELLAQIDSQEVADARLNLINALQQLEVARARLNWRETTYTNAIAMLEALKQGMPPEEIQEQFADRPVGRTREELLRAYSQYHLSGYEENLYENLRDKDAVAPARYRVEQAEFGVDRAIYRGLMDRLAFEETLEYTLARQRLREARTSVKVELETLRVLNASAEEILDRFESGELTRDAPGRSPLRTLSMTADAAIDPSRDLDELRRSEGTPVSTYDIRAPFAGTILERGRVVPGVVIDGREQLFTMADLDEVWVEAHVHEGDFFLLREARGGSVRFSAAAYPGRVFEGKVLYTGDLVDEKSRTIRMIAEARNPDRLLKPGMFVQIRVQAKDPRELPLVPSSAILTEGDEHFVFVQVDTERFERRVIETGRRNEEEDVVSVVEGLEPGDRVVVAGAFELKAELIAEEEGHSSAPADEAGGPGRSGGGSGD
ncbi:efflux RND transporter periplasmic adaptor subunit [Tautonia sp. JC769]|uniref:efflux RND transporter periplasmic adaptor subunit n=1 Tax=Tautonia sp. JC769 TaxID=3232135 RepID=UPI003458860C